MKTRILLIGLIISLFFLSNCLDFDLDLSGSGSYYPVYNDSAYNYPTNYPTYSSSIYIEPDSVDFHGNSSATLYFSAVADTTVNLNLINGGLDKMENVEERYTNRKIDTHIVNITTDDCLQDISIKSDSISLIMEKDEVYIFCFTMNKLEQNGFYFLYGYFYHHVLSNEQVENDSTEFYFEFEN